MLLKDLFQKKFDRWRSVSLVLTTCRFTRNDLTKVASSKIAY
jgi:hypothetical protein